MDLEERLSLIMREPTEEVVTGQELRILLETVARPEHYIGLEISGMLHLGSLILTGFKINDLIKAKVQCTVFLADWHTYINNKLQGDWEKIKKFSEYYSDAFRFFCPGVSIELGSDLYQRRPDYWNDFIRFSKQISLSRTIRSLTIMGRSGQENLDLAQLLYPPMQSIDIKALELDIVHAGMDQRKIHMLVREIFPKFGWKVPVSLHHHLLPGLSEPSIAETGEIVSKMSKTNPSSGILIHDDENTIKQKIVKGFCPQGEAENNPILELIRYVIFHEYREFVVERPQKYGGTVIYSNFKELKKSYIENKVHAIDLKNATARYLNRIIRPVREHFKGKEPNLIK
jgi:tyrosyl-tRNA synthetase